MKMRVCSVFLCVCMLMSCLTVGVSAATTPNESGNYAPLTFTASYGTTDGAIYSELAAMGDEAVAALASGTSKGIATDSSTGIPYQVFTVDVSSCPEAKILLTLDASTIENERLALKVHNPTTNEWDTLATAITEANGIGGMVDIATYATDGKIQAMAIPDYVANGSNRMIWSTDQQHYTEFEDLNQFYYDIHEYMVEEYNSGLMSYVINTGDIVDDNPSSSYAKGQWIVADKAFDILDEAGVPYGIETGNHDVGDYPANNYTMYLQYFGEERYANAPWFGGTADDNKSHYDLVTVGNVDFLMLYIGYGQGETQAVLEWANEVIAMYPHRSVILCTHQYLSPTTLEHKGRGDTLYEKIVLPNDNVVMVLSGHYEGAGYYTRNEDGRIIQEVQADYQFVQKESLEYYEGAKDPEHKIGSVLHCNGEGYIREMIIEGDTVKMYAFSPITGGVTPYGARDDLALEVPFADAQRQITTYRFMAGYASESGAAVHSQTLEDDTVVYSIDEAATSSYSATFMADVHNLQALIDTASELKKSDYTKDSYAALKEALKTAKKAVKSGVDSDVRTAFTVLENVMGALVIKEDTIDPDKLTTVLDLDLDLSAWENGDGTKGLFTDYSYIAAEQLEDGGFTAKASEKSPNTWPSIKYTEPLTFTPEDGKVYLYLDLEAGSTWSFYPTVIQDGTQYMGRWNYIIDGAYKKDGDAGAGVYKGVYDVTEALTDLGVDMTKEMTLSISVNVVPGPLTVHDMDILTGEYAAGFSLEDNLMWIVLGGVVLLGAIAIAVALLYKPKKKPEAEEATAEDSPIESSDPEPPTE